MWSSQKCDNKTKNQIIFCGLAGLNHKISVLPSAFFVSSVLKKLTTEIHKGVTKFTEIKLYFLLLKPSWRKQPNINTSFLPVKSFSYKFPGCGPQCQTNHSMPCCDS
jgi:Gpi18-like mannosyltransferase